MIRLYNSERFFPESDKWSKHEIICTLQWIYAYPGIKVGSGGMDREAWIDKSIPPENGLSSIELGPFSKWPPTWKQGLLTHLLSSGLIHVESKVSSIESPNTKIFPTKKMMEILHVHDNCKECGEIRTPHWLLYLPMPTNRRCMTRFIITCPCQCDRIIVEHSTHASAILKPIRD